MRTAANLIKALDQGIPITDGELMHLKDRLVISERELSMLSYDKYSLMLLDIRQKIELVDSYQRARKE